MLKKRSVRVGSAVAIFVVALLFTSVLCCFAVCKLYRHEQRQNAEIQFLSQEINRLKSEITPPNCNWSTDGYNYLAIGNSITVHGYAEYWWDNDRGMAASTDEKDYVHLVKAHLEDTGLPVTMYTMNFSAWEVNGNDRAEFLVNLDPFLSDRLDLVTIQLGENATNIDTWLTDFSELISYVKEHAPNSQIIVVGDFWSLSNRDVLKRQAAELNSVAFVSLDDILGQDEYYAGIGSSVEGKDGEPHFIEHSGVALHPGDKGMKAIADRIIAVLEQP